MRRGERRHGHGNRIGARRMRCRPLFLRSLRQGGRRLSCFTFKNKEMGRRGAGFLLIGPGAAPQPWPCGARPGPGRSARQRA
ncbi:hypothetical protein HMPREF0731_2040, partial [Pseudoroseomonas cervicalis ATCC 49957]